MSGPANATTNKKTGSRFYEWNGERFWSVTTVIGCLDKPAIPRWAAKRAAEFAIENADSWLALTRTGQTTAAVDLIKNAPWRERDAAADVGTAVHKAVELYTLGQSFPSWPEDVAGHMVQFEKFLNAYEPEFELAEATLYHRGHKWAGTTDGVCTFRKAPPQHQFLIGKRAIIDYKTSNEGRQGHGIYPEVALQLNAYAHGEFVGMPDGSEAELPEIEEGAAVWLRPDKWALVPVRIDDEIYNAFRYVIEAFRWATDIAPTVLGKAATAA
jgi:hypothetical protein